MYNDFEVKYSRCGHELEVSLNENVASLNCSCTFDVETAQEDDMPFLPASRDEANNVVRRNSTSKGLIKAPTVTSSDNCRGDSIQDISDASISQSLHRKDVLDDGLEVEVDHSHSSDNMGCAEAFMHRDFAQIALQMAQGAEEFIRSVWYRGWLVVGQQSLPQWLRDNEFLHKWHRPELKSFYACFNSIFRIHTETGNIWTHLLGCIAFLSLAVFFLSQPNSKIQWQEKVVFGFFFMGAVFCLGFSFIFHTVYCHSEKIGNIFNKMDYCGISFLVMGSFVPWIYYSFYCSLILKCIYLVSIMFLGSCCIVVCMFDKFATPKYRSIRAILFITLGLCGVFPALHYVLIEGFWNGVYQASLGWLSLMAMLYITGAVIYAVRIPERIIPGMFDLWGQSHQIFHIFAVVAAFVHYHGAVHIASYRLSNGDCPLISL